MGKKCECPEDMSNKRLEPDPRHLCRACCGSGVIEESIDDGDGYEEVECAACGGSGYED